MAGANDIASQKAQDFVAGLSGAATTGLSTLAEAGRAALADLPVPTRKSERWKYSPITAMLLSDEALSGSSAPSFSDEFGGSDFGPGGRRRE